MALKKIALKKTGNSLSLKTHTMPLYDMTANPITSPTEIIPAFDPGKFSAKKAYGIRITDLPKIKLENMAAAHSVHSFLDHFVGEFYPLYGIFPQPSNCKIYLSQSVVTYTDSNSWHFEGGNSFSNELLSFDFADQPDQWYYIKFEVAYSHCVATITVGTSSSRVFLNSSGFTEGSFGIFVKSKPNSFSPHIEFKIDKQYPENASYVLRISNIKLYRTVRIPERDTL